LAKKSKNQQEDSSGFSSSKKDGKQGVIKDKESKKPMILYSIFVVLFSLILFAITNQSWFESISDPISGFYAKASSALINIFGAKTSVDGLMLGSDDFSMSIKKGCDAIAPMILYSMAILAFPVALKLKWKSILTGIGALAVLNIIRICSLYFVGKDGNKGLFDIMHEDIWPIVFIVFTLFLWLMWMKSVFSKTEENANN